MIAGAPRLVSIARKLAEWAKKSNGSVPESLSEILKDCRDAITALDHAAE
jgi:hypothetical protein